MSDGMTDKRGQADAARAEQPIAKFTDHITFLDEVARDDVRAVEIAEQAYGSSWKKRGGVGAFMMLSRKWDRIENALRPHADDDALANLSGSLRDRKVAPWDIFGAIVADPRPEGIIDDIRDLRRYLLLVESEMRARGAISAQSRNR
ncbi:nucleotide modification [Pseudanabaena phage Pam3]|nr:nucleotide modification [Pseudanabaena phage Pam3]